jgi:hypothetical protein
MGAERSAKSAIPVRSKVIDLLAAADSFDTEVERIDLVRVDQNGRSSGTLEHAGRVEPAGPPPRMDGFRLETAVLRRERQLSAWLGCSLCRSARGMLLLTVFTRV